MAADRDKVRSAQALFTLRSLPFTASRPMHGVRFAAPGRFTSTEYMVFDAGPCNTCFGELLTIQRNDQYHLSARGIEGGRVATELDAASSTEESGERH